MPENAPGENTPPGTVADGTVTSPLTASRRRFLQASGVAAAGAGAAIVMLDGPDVGAASATPAHTHVAAGSPRPVLDGKPVIVHVLDADTGRISVFTENSEVISTDPELVRHLVRAVRAAR
jgi:hypothetical protein